MKLPIMPDIPLEYVQYLNEHNPHLMIFNERNFIKRIDAKYANIDALLDLKNLKLEGTNTPLKIFISEDYQFIYFITRYLENYKSLCSITEMNEKDILLIFKKIFEYLSIAHQHNFNPYDLNFTNYLLDSNNNPIFIDFDICFINGRCTDIEFRKTLFQIEAFGKSSRDLSQDNLNLSDKIILLDMLLQSLNKEFSTHLDNNIEACKLRLELLKQKYNLCKEAKDTLDSIILGKQQPSDYLVDSLINPLLDNGLQLKR